jgi:serine protease AprX
LSNVEVKMRLRESARDLGYPKKRQGWGIPDAEKLLRLAQRG